MQQGNISLALLILLAALILNAIMLAQARVIRASNDALALFDSTKKSSLYCRASFEELIINGPTQLKSTLGSHDASAIPCLPGRWDHAAPGLPRSSASPIICAIIHRIKSPNAKLRGILCD